MNDNSVGPGLCIVLEVGQGAPPGDRLDALLRTAEPVSLILAPAPGGALKPGTIHPLIERVQARGIAVLIENDAALARTLKADGVHLAWSNDIIARYQEAREILGTRYMVGADAGQSRHDAMALGETGADYIAFGIPSHVEDRDTAAARRLDLVQWWGEIFVIPLVAFDVASPREAADLASVGADFIAVHLALDKTADELGALIAGIKAAAENERESAPGERS